MFQYLLVVCLISSALANEAQSGRIVGGRQAGPGQFPFQASLRDLKNSHVCGAVIINERWLLTAAHCTMGSQPYQLRVVVGSIDRTTGGTSYNLWQIIEHPDFNERSLDNDIALMQTGYPIVMTTQVKSVNMGDSIVPAGKIAVVSGWGKLQSDATASTMLQYMEVRTLDNLDCRLRHDTYHRTRIHSGSLCTFSRVGKGTCMGDSGSPLIVDGVLAGLVSWGVPCAVGKPDVYTRVATHRSWILSTTRV
ncbi:chymotrypsin-1-like [Sabethes cyaneus]|uniref:chymotrypsin-1-like n=1 Tax=Sabethes cyaneus TaxID=53552 RepID=UPI00237E58A9|nr:chymotrypsin-1-like [Sabethes cyaneus]